MRRSKKLLRVTLAAVLLAVFAWEAGHDAVAAFTYFHARPVLLAVPLAVGVVGGLVFWLFAGIRRGPVGLGVVILWGAANTVICLYYGARLAPPAVSLLADVFDPRISARMRLEGLAVANWSLLGAGVIAFGFWWLWYRFGYRRLMRQPAGKEEDAAEDAG